MKALSILLLLACASVSLACTLGTVTGCDSSGSAAGITAQIVAELGAKYGYSFRTPNPANVHCNGWTCTLQNNVATALENAARSRNDYITLSSAFRSSAEQYILYRWYQNGHQCGISLAAAPGLLNTYSLNHTFMNLQDQLLNINNAGSSNHEGGRAIDTPYWSYWLSTLQAYGFTHSYPGSDPVHFDYLGAPDLDRYNLMV